MCRYWDFLGEQSVAPLLDFFVDLLVYRRHGRLLTQLAHTRNILQNLKEKYDELDSKKLITEEYLGSDSYVNLMIDILNRVHSLNTVQKRKTVAEIYKSVLQNRIEYEDSDERLFVDALAKINTQEIVILNFIEYTGAKYTMKPE